MEKVNIASAVVLVVLASLVPAVPSGAEPIHLRFATYNASMFRATAGQLVTDLSTTSNAQARRVAEIIQRVRPDVLLINEFDYSSRAQAPALFQSNYLGVSQNGKTPIIYPFRYAAAVNTGEPSGMDFNNDGITTGPCLLYTSDAADE